MVHLLVVHPLVVLSFEACDDRIHYDSTYLDNMDRYSTQVEGLCSNDHSNLEEDPFHLHLFFFVHLSCEEVYLLRNHLFPFAVLGYNDQSLQVVDPCALVYRLPLFSFFTSSGFHRL